jgi:hypothetical protein
MTETVIPTHSEDSSPGWDENPRSCRGVHAVDNSIPVKTNFYALVQLSYWDNLDKSIKAKFKLVKKCKWQRKCIVQAKRDTTLPQQKWMDVLMVSQHYMD